mmetsp:Transcript_2628/g.2931  ORF Transcript_2628/g.2931 Transcript_2628/m.2931 type:complete len:364 (+) Transcript_2628:229-1320(+)|eukprot:CAMPEP_0197856786 /NCGR_PEP_ID=MMETSP1438-20131217/29248_1 /TAXON_ID=1461541 /ORGANISM="Pterosperma sp., Strain CCMP1384" /LENGTH=363 /DNA_ID=CAMNT_0043472367 /DNA_START=227 /DNA_END=1318 /DNA_ORIENTATION=+
MEASESSQGEDLRDKGWEHIQALGQGAYGSVHLYRITSTGEEYAIKFIDRGDSINEGLRREVINHRLLVHNNICRFKEVLLTSRKLGVVMEYAAGGDLFSYVQKSRERRLPENISRYFFQQLISGLTHMHRQGICHRDMKLENLLLLGNPPMLKICDFGYSKSSRLQSAAKTKVGTAAYIAPEILKLESNNEYDGIQTDVWSAGVILHTMLMGMYPFCDPRQPNNEAFTMQRIVAYSKGQVQYTPPPHVSAECQELLKQMLVPAPENRIGLGDLCKLKWFQTNLPREFTVENGTRVDNAFPQMAEDQVIKLLTEASAPAEGAVGAELCAAGSCEMGMEPTNSGLSDIDFGHADSMEMADQFTL